MEGDCKISSIISFSLSFCHFSTHPHHNFVPSRSADQSGSGSVVPEMYIVEVMGGGGGGGQCRERSVVYQTCQLAEKGGGREAEKGTGCRFNAPHLQEFAAL